MIAGITYNFLPFMALPLYVSLEKIDRRLIEAATDLYASRARRRSARSRCRWRCPGIFAGSLLTFIPAVGDFINAQLLGTSRQYMIGNVIQSKFLVVADYPTAAALSFVLMAVLLVIVLRALRSARARARRRALPRRRSACTRSRRRGRIWRDCASCSALWAALALLYLFLPIFVVVLFSFNDNKGRFNLTWQGFTLDHWEHPFGVPGLGDGVRQLARDRGDLDGDRGRARDVHGARARALRLPRPRRASTCSSSCRWPRPRSCSAPRCSGCS